MSRLTVKPDAPHNLIHSLQLQPDDNTSRRARTRSPQAQHVKPWLRWVVIPSSTLKVLATPLLLSGAWNVIFSQSPKAPPNPFDTFFKLSHPIPTDDASSPFYTKGYGDLPFIAFCVVAFCLVRQVLAVNVSRKVARSFGLTKEAKLDRFGEQGYAFVYFAIMGAWGYRVMSQISTAGYQTRSLWTDYPHSRMTGELKAYSLIQIAYWAQQFLVLVLGLEKPRKDYYELIIHHVVANWLAGWIYFLNISPLSNMICLTTDIPDTILALSKCLNYLRFEKAKVCSFAIFVLTWIYGRHVLEFYLLKSIWSEFGLLSPVANQWKGSLGVYMPSWMRYQIFFPLFVLQLLNLYWTKLILKILVRTATTATVEDDRSDDEDDGEEKPKPRTRRSKRA